MNFRLLPRSIQSTPSSSPPIWSSNDTKRSKKQARVIWSWPVRPVQRKAMRTAHQTKKRTKAENKNNLYTEEFWGKTQGFHLPSCLSGISKLESRFNFCFFFSPLLVPYRDLHKNLSKSRGMFYVPRRKTSKKKKNLVLGSNCHCVLSNCLNSGNVRINVDIV